MESQDRPSRLVHLMEEAMNHRGRKRSISDGLDVGDLPEKIFLPPAEKGVSPTPNVSDPGCLDR
jgi:hypothetical protein